MARNPFGDDVAPTPRPNPFGEEPLDPMKRIEGAPARLRALKSRIGAEGMTGVEMRQLLDELAGDIEAIGRLLRER